MAKDVAAELESINKQITKASAHVGTARSVFNKNRDTADVVDQAQTLAWIAAAESLNAIAKLAALIVEVGTDE